MKSTVADWQSLVFCLRIVARDGTTIRLVQYPHDLVMSNGSIYKSDLGYEFTGLSSEAGSAAAVMDLGGLLASTGISVEGLAEGKWDNARLYLFATSWAAPAEDEEEVACFIFGKTRVGEHSYTTEMMQLIDAINQPVGRVETALCPWTLFDETLDGKVLPYTRSRCGGPRGLWGTSSQDGPRLQDYLVSGEISAVSSRTEFVDGSRAEEDDYFSKGEIKFTTGANAGLPALKIKSYSGSSGAFETHDPALYPVQAGDQYIAIPGCRKRRLLDCVVKYQNGPNFGGADTVPPPEAMTEVGGVT